MHQQSQLKKGTWHCSLAKIELTKYYISANVHGIVHYSGTTDILRTKLDVTCATEIKTGPLQCVPDLHPPRTPDGTLREAWETLALPLLWGPAASSPTRHSERGTSDAAGEGWRRRRGRTRGTSRCKSCRPNRRRWRGLAERVAGRSVWGRGCRRETLIHSAGAGRLIHSAVGEGRRRAPPGRRNKCLGGEELFCYFGCLVLGFHVMDSSSWTSSKCM
jgi:hypothetical protein